MSRLFFTVSLLIAGTFNAAFARGEEDSPAADAVAALRVKIDAVAQPFIDDGRAMGLVVGVVSPEGTHVFGYGRKLKGEDGSPDGDSLFEIGSITKVFTGLVLAGMAEEGLVKLDDPVRTLLPEGVKVPARGDKEITLLNLSTHSSALPRVPLALLFAGLENPYAKFQPEQLYEALAATELQKDIGGQSEYSNLGVGLLGHALALRAGMSYEELVKQRVCQPLSLADTTVTLSDEQRARLATGHTAEGEPTGNWDFDALAGAGAIRSTAHDMLRFASAQLGLTESPLAAAIATSQQVHFDGEGGRYGLGWVLQKARGGELDFIWHNGGTGGYCSFLGIVKQKQLGVVVLCNTSLIGRGSAADEVAGNVIRSLLEE